jgi:hypothetical protein
MGEYILKTLIELLEQQEEIKITYNIEREDLENVSD